MKSWTKQLPAIGLGLPLILGGHTVAAADTAVTSEVKRTQYQDWSVLCNKQAEAEICQM